MARTITLDEYARFDRRRGRNDSASPLYRTRCNRLEALALAAASIPFLSTNSPAPGVMSPRAKAERNLTGLIRAAYRSGATVRDIAGATGMSREWARSKANAYTPADRGSNVWGN